VNHATRPEEGPPRARTRKGGQQKKELAHRIDRLALKTFAFLFMASLATSRDRLKGMPPLAQLR
jgi:hypothetical protein